MATKNNGNVCCCVCMAGLPKALGGKSTSATSRARKVMSVADESMSISESGVEVLKTDEAEDVMGPPLGRLKSKESNRLKSKEAGGSSDRPTGRRPSADMMALHYVCTNMPPGIHKDSGPVTRQTVKEGMYVKRGPDWKWGDEDGCDERPGMVMHVDESASTATVIWATGDAYGHYRFGNKCDLSEYQNDDISASSVPWSRRNTQPMYAMKNQTAIVLDWDDTLFPSTFLRFTLRLSPRFPMEQQMLAPQHRQYAESIFKECADHVLELLQCVHEIGRVVIVSLAKKPWVTDSCAYFYPRVGERLQELGVKIVYAQESLTDTPAALTRGMSDEEILTFWSKVKGQAITGVLEEIHTLYAGQSWKNVISIGDSEFERLGTKGAIQKYASERGICTLSPTPREIGGHVYKVRSKTFKMLDSPSAEELMLQIQMIQRWLPFLVNLDDNFDGDLNDVHDMDAISQIEAQLKIA